MEKVFVRSGEILVDGVRSPLIEASPSDANEAVVFVHGNPGSRLDWHDLVERTGTFARAVAFDAPGFGQADKPRWFDATVPGYAAFIQGALAELGIDRAHLVLHDFGVPWGLTWAASHPDAFASVVIVNGPPVSGYRWYLLAKVWRTPVAGELLHWTLTPPTFRWLMRRGNPKGLPDAVVERMRRDYDRGTQRTVLRLYRATDAAKMVPAPVSLFAELDRPALVMWGSQDVYIPIAYAEDHRLAFPSAEIRYLPESGHFPILDDPEGVAGHVIPFLRAMTGASA
jgi:pimeloyl-ACP methyl ester carboxylesterase